MSDRSARVLLPAAAAAAALLLAGCSDDEPSEPTTYVLPSPSRTLEPEPEPFDPRGVDLANTEWTFAVAGWEDEPVPVTLSDGSSEITVHDWEGEVSLGDEILYVDMDADGDEDAVAALRFSAAVSSDTLQWVATSWYVWVNDGSALTQVVHPLEGSGDCADADPVITAAEGGGVVIEQSLMPIEGGTCAEGATIPTSRTVVVQAGADGEAWLVQTEPVAAWGGDCPTVTELGYNPIDLVVAPGLDQAAPAEGTATIAETPPSWLDDAVPGWYPVGFTVDERPDLTWYCGWRQPS